MELGVKFMAFWREAIKVREPLIHYAILKEAVVVHLKASLLLRTRLLAISLCTEQTYEFFFIKKADS
jgi:hypothetical protein